MAKPGLSESERKELLSENAGEDAAPTGAPKKNKMGLIIVILVLLLGGAGAGLYFSGMLPFNKGGASEGAGDKAEAGSESGKGDKSEAGHGDKKPVQAGAGNGPVFFNFPSTPDNPGTFTANLNTGGKQPVFLNMEVTLELPGASDLEAVNANLPRIQDLFNTYLRELRPSDLQGSAGIYRLREELLLRANKAIAPAKVNDVLFKKIVVQ